MGFRGAWRQYGVSGGMAAIWGFGGMTAIWGFGGHDGNMGFRGQHRPDSPVALSIRWSYIASVAGGAVEERTHTACSVTVLVLGGMQALPFPDRRQPLFPICVGYFPYHHNAISALKPRYIHLHCFPIWVRFALAAGGVDLKMRTHTACSVTSTHAWGYAGSPLRGPAAFFIPLFSGVSVRPRGVCWLACYSPDRKSRQASLPLAFLSQPTGCQYP